jgi:enamine deaminase RidA (YjgF/YER057c/UK114 family)
MTKVERFYIGPQIATATTKSESSAAGVPVITVTRANGMVWTNGVVSTDPETGEYVGGDIRVQTRRVLENLKLGLQKAGTSFDRVVMVHSFLRDMNDWPGYHEIYSQYFDHNNPPPRYTVRAEMADPRWLLEIHMTAVV